MIKPAESSMPSREAFQALVERANNGDESALQEMRRTLDDNPVIWQRLGDLPQYVRTTMLQRISGGDVLIAESIGRVADQLQESLTPESCSAIELLAVERVVAAWLEMHWLDALPPAPQGATIKQQRHHLSLKSSAQSRFDQALKSLATLQRLRLSPPKPAKRKAAETKSAAAKPNRKPKRNPKRNPVRQYELDHRLRAHFANLDPASV